MPMIAPWRKEMHIFLKEKQLTCHHLMDFFYSPQIHKHYKHLVSYQNSYRNTQSFPTALIETHANRFKEIYYLLIAMTNTEGSNIIVARHASVTDHSLLLANLGLPTLPDYRNEQN